MNVCNSKHLIHVWSYNRTRFPAYKVTPEFCSRDTRFWSGTPTRMLLEKGNIYWIPSDIFRSTPNSAAVLLTPQSNSTTRRTKRQNRSENQPRRIDSGLHNLIFNFKQSDHTSKGEAIDLMSFFNLLKIVSCDTQLFFIIPHIKQFNNRWRQQ